LSRDKTSFHPRVKSGGMAFRIMLGLTTSAPCVDGTLSSGHHPDAASRQSVRI
jgi:hypothetical protein